MTPFLYYGLLSDLPTGNVKPVWHVSRAEAVGTEIGTQFHYVQHTLTM